MKVLTMLLAVMVSTGAKADEIQCLASTIFSEARGEPLAGKIAVGHTVINRMKKLNRSACWVTQHGYTRKPVSHAAMQEYRNLSARILAGETVSAIGQRDSFDSNRRRPRHAKQVLRIGGHAFYMGG